MLIIHHRINEISRLPLIPRDEGVEIDLRTNGRSVILHHEPFEQGDRLEDYLDAYGPHRKSPLVLNMKEDLLEERVIALCRERGIANYFFLDCAFPTLVRLVKTGITNVAVRLSEYEPMETARAFQGQCAWAWVDCFTGKPPAAALIREVQGLGYRVCLVSPELQGFEDPSGHLSLRALLTSDDAVCTKRADLWGRT